MHEAASQAINYLVSLDEERNTLYAKGIDCRRAAATVVIGHPQFQSTFTEQQINEAIRVYNTSLSRVEVTTFKAIIDGARRALEGPGSDADPGVGQEEIDVEPDPEPDWQAYMADADFADEETPPW